MIVMPGYSSEETAGWRFRVLSRRANYCDKIEFQSPGNELISKVDGRKAFV